MKLLTIIFLTLCSFAFSQEHGVDSKNNIYGEVLGNSDQVFSANYERNYSLSGDNRFRIAGRAGIGVGFVDQAKNDMTPRYSIPVQVIVLYGNHNNVEFILGFTPTFGKNFTNTLKDPAVTYRKYENMYYAGVGYRLIATGGFVVRVNPMIEFPSVNNRKAGFVLGVSLGYAL